MFSDTVLKYAPWSYSMANTAITCSLAFNKRYVDHEPRAEPEARITTVGTVIHTILELVGRGATVGMSFKRALESYELTNDVKMDVRTFRDAVESFARGLEKFDAKFGIAKRLIESEFAINKDFKGNHWYDKKTVLRGKIDLVLVTKEAFKRAIVIDHKSGTVKDLAYHVDQLTCYAVLLDAVVPGLRAVRSGIHSAGADPKADGTRTTWMEQIPISTVQTECRKHVINFLTRAASSVETRTSSKGWMCNFCGYKPVCPEYKK